MPRRPLLTEQQWARLLAPPTDEREIVRYWTLSREDLDIIIRKRSDHGRLRLALLLCYLCYPGRVLGAEEVPPVALVSFVARQLGISPTAFAKYSQRDQTRREQLAELMEWLHYRTFDRASFRIPKFDNERRNLARMGSYAVQGRRVFQQSRKGDIWWRLRGAAICGRGLFLSTVIVKYVES